MKLELLRYFADKKHTKGILTLDDKVLCHTLEDPWRAVKIPGETRIPDGTYDLGLRIVGGFHQRYSASFSNFHKGMIEVLDVPNFTYILLHIGNYPSNTEGCILVGTSSSTTTVINNSTRAYKKIYPDIAERLLAGEHVSLEIKSVASAL